MANSVLNDLLKEYDKKKMDAEKNLDIQKSILYSKYPDLENIEKKLNMAGINSVRSILLSNNFSTLDNLNNIINNLKIERSSLLKKYNIPDNYLVPNYDCKKCNDTGYITTNTSTVMCSCLKQRLTNALYNKSNIYNLDKENFDTFNISMYSDKVNKEKYKSNLSPKENIIKIKNIIFSFINNFDNTDEKNLLFTGNTRSR